MAKNSTYIKIYSFLLQLFLGTNSVELKLKIARFIGEFTAKNYVGIFREPHVEEFFKKYSEKHFIIEKNRIAKNTNNHLVHVFTTTYQTGGHTRFVENLIQLDKTRTHHLLITEQGNIEARENLLELVQKNNGNTLIMDATSIHSRVTQFQNFILENAGEVMLHIHPYDFLPSIALHPLKEKIEILFFNHADHCFSFGIDVSSKIVNIREEAHKISVHKRNFKNSVVLPLPIIKREFSENDCIKIRSKYGIDPGFKVAISIGSAYKFQRKDNHYFFRTIFQAVERHDNLKVFVIGLDQSDLDKHHLDFIPHERILLMGIIEDPSEIQAIADIAIDPMPFGSYTALLETSFYGAYPLVCYDTVPLFDLYQDPAFSDMITMDKNESEYLNHLEQVLSGQHSLNKEQIKSNIESFHCSQNWIDRFDHIMKKNIIDGNSEVPTELDRIAFMNEDLENGRYRLMAFLYDNIELFGKKEVYKIMRFLITSNYPLRDSVGIFKRFIFKH